MQVTQVMMEQKQYVHKQHICLHEIFFKGKIYQQQATDAIKELLKKQATRLIVLLVSYKKLPIDVCDSYVTG